MDTENLYEEFGGSDLEAVEDETNEEARSGDNVEGPNSAENEENKQTVAKPKRVVRNPQPKLNAETLKGKRGLTALESHFDRVKYKGRGHEEQDLAVILKTYEYWCHRLFPKYPFDECITKIENLGSKREVVTHIKKIRMDMLYEDEPIINDADNDSEGDNNLMQNFDDLMVPTVELTAEQQEIIRINRERAQKLRQDRIKQRADAIDASLSTAGTLDLVEIENSDSHINSPLEATALRDESQSEFDG